MPIDRETTLPMSPARLDEIKVQAAALTYAPTKKAADELLAEVDRLRECLTWCERRLDPVFAVYVRKWLGESNRVL